MSKTQTVGARWADFDTLANEWTDVPAPIGRDDVEAAAAIDPRAPLRPDGSTQIISDRFRYSPTPLRVYAVASQTLNVGSNQIVLPSMATFYKLSNRSGQTIYRSIENDRGIAGMPLDTAQIMSEMCEFSTLYIYCTAATTLNVNGATGVVLEYGW